MKLSEIVAACGFKAAEMPNPDAEITGAYTSDLLSDVMAHCSEGSLLVTVQNHKNSIAVCTLVGSPGVVVAHGRPIPEDMAEAARQEGIAVLVSEESQFAISCRLGKLLEAAR